jgi:hypothetical protein
LPPLDWTIQPWLINKGLDNHVAQRITERLVPLFGGRQK